MKFDPYIDMTSPGLLEASTALETIIREKYPSAQITREWLDDPDGLHLRVTAPFSDPEEVFDLVAEELLHFQIDEGLPLYVVPHRPSAQVIKQLRNQSDNHLPPQANP